MKIVLYYPFNMYAGWYTIGGYQNALKRLGHDVLVCALPGNNVQNVDAVRLDAPTLKQLNEADVVLSTYHEYVQPWLKAIYGFERWSSIKTPIVARFDESMDRSDLGLPTRVPELLQWADAYSFPTVQDAKRWGGQWDPYGADLEVFHPPTNDDPSLKIFDLGFIGTMYQVRLQYLQGLSSCLNDVTFHCGPVVVQDLRGVLGVESTVLMADNYRRIKIFFCLPGIAKMILAKVFDVMACGTFVMCPGLYGDAKENMSIFENERDLVYYEQGYMVKNADQIHYYLCHDAEREKIARNGAQRIRQAFTIEAMLKKILELSSLGKRPRPMLVAS